MTQRPSNFLNWVPDGDPSKVMQPTDELAAQGYSPNEPPTSQNLNYIFRNLDLWNQWLAGQSAIYAASASLFNNTRLEDGGYWSWYLSSSRLLWTQTFYIAIPGIADTCNQCGPSSLMLADGQLAYVNVNVPIFSAGDVSSGSNEVVNLTQVNGISLGQTVTGNNIPDGTTVTAVSGNTVQLSNEATDTADGNALTFVNDTALVAQTADRATFQPDANSLVFAVRYGDVVYVGVNAITIVVNNAEWKQLAGQAYTALYGGTFGEPATIGQAVYISDGTDGNTAGQFYLCDASANNGATRSNFLGFVVDDAVNTGDTGTVVCDGTCSGFFSNLATGKTYYLDPSTRGAITSTAPSVTGQYTVAVGVAEDASDLLIRVSNFGALQTATPWPEYGVANEAQFIAAINKCNDANGGVIVLLAPMEISTAFVGNYTTVLGRGWKTALRVSGTYNGGLGVGNCATLVNVCFANTDGLSAGLCTVWGNRTELTQCSFSAPRTSNMPLLAMNGSQNKVTDSKFYGCVNSDTVTGVVMNGQENDVDDPKFYYDALPFNP